MYFWSRIPFLPNGVNTFHAESDVIQNYQNIFTIALKPWNWFHSKTEKFVCPSGINQFQVLICLQKCKNTGFHTSGCCLNVTVQIWHQPNINFTFTFSRWQNFTWAINGRGEEDRSHSTGLHILNMQLAGVSYHYTNGLSQYPKCFQELLYQFRTRETISPENRTGWKQENEQSVH